MSTIESSESLPRELVLASAGSGKTYHLSSRVIELLAAGAAPGDVLASTFTRKAAGEILDRVLVRLAEGASDAEKASELGRDTHPRLADVAECRTLLARLLNDLHQMNVGTLDAFFIRVARSFFQELGLAPGWTLTDKPTEDRLRTEAVQAALHKTDKSELLELLRMINRGAANRKVHDDLVDKVDELLRIRRQVDTNVVDVWRPSFDNVESFTVAQLTEATEELAARLRALEVPLTKKGDPAKAWVKARDDGANYIEALDWTPVFAKGLGAKVLAQEEEYSRHPITAQYADIFNDAAKLARSHLAPQLTRECEAMGRLAGLLEDAFGEAQRRLGAYRFEDVTYMLGGPDPAGKRDDLHYRLDQQVRHILLDEFQDTSLEQWRALSPLVDELLSGHPEERAGVIVADPKQSIYGWRGARPELVHQVGARYGLARESMDKSWRSSAVVLDFVEAVFRDIPSNSVMTSFDVGPKMASAWVKDLTPLRAAKDLPGHVCVHLGPSDGDSRVAIRPHLLRRAAEVVRDLHEQMPDRTIGVLVRRNKVLGHFMNALNELGVRASGEGGTPLTDTAPVNAVLSLLRLADHPLSGAARYHVARSPLGSVVGLKDFRDKSAARALADRVRARLLTDGYGPTLAEWVTALAPRCDAREVMRLLQLVELGHRWDERSTLRPTDFVRYVAQESVEDPSSAPVRVMTVHRSKGLEFDVVVLPELYASMTSRGTGVAIPERDPESGLVVQVYPRVHKDLRPLFPEIGKADEDLQAANLRDGLSVLYVALTRARYALHLVLPPEGGSAKHSAGLIRSALGLEDGNATEADIVWEAGEPRWSEQLDDGAGHADAMPPESSASTAAGTPPESSASTAAATPPEAAAQVHEANDSEAGARDADAAAQPLLRPPSTGPGRNLARRSPSSLEGGSGVDLAFHLKLDAGPALQRGSVVHAWCEEVEWIEDGLPGDDALRAVARGVAPGISDADVSGFIEEFRGWLEVEEIRQALSRGAYATDAGATLHVENELPFARRVGSDIQEGFIDRLVLIERDGEVVEAEVLDFKTDRIAADDGAGLAERVEHYRPQLEAYCAVVRERFGLEENAVRGTLLFLGAGVVRGVVQRLE